MREKPRLACLGAGRLLVVLRVRSGTTQVEPAAPEEQEEAETAVGGVLGSSLLGYVGQSELEFLWLRRRP